MSSNLSQEQFRLLNDVVKTAAEETSRIFTKWMRVPVDLKIGTVESIPFLDLIKKTPHGNDASIALYVPMVSGVSGSLLLIFSEKTAFDFVDILMRRPVGTTRMLGSIESSALQETANIIDCAFLNVLGNRLDVVITPGTPSLIQDMPGSIMQSLLLAQAATQNEALYASFDFCQDSARLDWNFYFLPYFESLQPLLDRAMLSKAVPSRG